MGAQSSVPTAQAVTDFLDQTSKYDDSRAIADLRQYADLT
jgi:hypothetical protein